MEERLLIRCENSISANNIVNVLNSNNIALRQHDETQDPRFGAYGPAPGVAIYVFEKDYEKAQELINPIIKEIDENTILCPKCGSEDVKPIVRKHDYFTITMLLALFFMIAPAVYYGWTKGNFYPIVNTMALIMVVIGVILLFISSLFKANYECNQCGKKFNHR